MVLPVTIGEQTGVQNSYHGPFRNSAGNVYTILVESVTNDAEIIAFKATDPTNSFTEVDSGNRPVMGDISTRQVLSINGFQKSDLIHIATQNADTDDVFYARLDMTADAWVDLGTSDFDILIDATASDTSITAQAADICVLDDNKIRVVYQGETDKVMGTSFNRIHHAWSSDGGVTWTGGTNGDNALALSAVGDEGDSTGPRIATDGTDAWVVWNQTHDTDLRNLFEASIHPDDTVQGTLQDTGFEVLSTETYPVMHGVVFDRLGIKKVRFGYLEVTTNDFEVLEFDVTQDPTSFDTSTVTTDHVSLFGGACLAVDGSTVHQAMGNITQGNDLYTSNDQDSDTWPSIVEFRDAVTVIKVSCNVIWRDGPKLAMIYESSGVVKYDEFPITYTLGNLSDAIMSDQNQRAGPFEV